jgi:hypothetical protein
MLGRSQSDISRPFITSRPSTRRRHRLDNADCPTPCFASGLDAESSRGNSGAGTTHHVSFTLGEQMRRSAFAMYAACFLWALPVNAQEKQPLIPDRPLYRPDRQSTPTVTEALKSLRAITVGDIRTMSDNDLRQLTDLLKQWIDISAIEEKRREESRKGKGSKLP